MPVLSDPFCRQPLRLLLLAASLAGLLLVSGAVRAEIFEGDEAYESSDEEMEGEEGSFGFQGDDPPSIQRGIDADDHLARKLRMRSPASWAAKVRTTNVAGFDTNTTSGLQG
ncbi:MULTISPECIES: hypothetical protein [Microvirga]|uniref:hypothetical protein n=1 Tax=Microvirga TaxID=186650 RepID=UPI00191FC625|nr:MULTISPECIES: hypothetical protein [Microvirga]MBM6581684.1 hypothetical protein [Microvirga arvi]